MQPFLQLVVVVVIVVVIIVIARTTITTKAETIGGMLAQMGNSQAKVRKVLQQQ